MSKILFFLSVGIVVFVYGIAVEKYKIFPHSWIAYTKQSVEMVFADIGMVTGTRPEQHIKPAPAGVGTVVPGGGQTIGYTAVSGFFGDGMEIRLLGEDGETAYRL